MTAPHTTRTCQDCTWQAIDGAIIMEAAYRRRQCTHCGAVQVQRLSVEGWPGCPRWVTEWMSVDAATEARADELGLML